MTHQLTSTAPFEDRLGRFPLVMLLVMGLLLSLLHCATCCPDILTQTPVSVATNFDQGTASEGPDQQLPCLNGHCLSHVVQQAMIAATIPADIASRKLAPTTEVSPSGLGSIPPLEPPRG